MNAEELLNDIINVIRLELLKQAARHRQSATEKLRKYYHGDIQLTGMIDGVRLEVTGATLEGLGKVLTLEKVEQWREEQKETKG